MEILASLLQNALKHFNSKINLLIVDDDRNILRSLSKIFDSPVFKITTVDNFNDTIKTVRFAPSVWHCWLLDIDLGENRTGLQVMQEFPQFPFVVVLSGLQSMSIAAEAVKQGALAVYDKDPDSLDRLYDETCKTAALGYVMGGKLSQYLAAYRLLCKSVITSPEEWAEKACVSPRQLHRICEIHPKVTPKATLSCYYALYCMLYKGKPPFNAHPLPGMSKESMRYISECFEYCLKKQM